jgi:hypothetical protein
MTSFQMTWYLNLNFINFTLDHLLCIIGVIVSILDSRAEDRGFEAQSDQTKNNKINIFCFSNGQVLLVEETGVPGENHQPATSH